MTRNKPMNKCSSCGKKIYCSYGKGKPSVCYDCYKKGNFIEYPENKPAPFTIEMKDRENEPSGYVPLRKDGPSFHELVTGSPTYNGRKTYIDDRGYVRFKETGKLVHREVAYHEMYLPNRHLYSKPFRKYVVHHIDKNTVNNNPSNLEILSKPDHGKKHEDTGCFIATAAYGTPFTEEINILRMWRDSINKGFLGRIFVRFYYFISPAIADFIRPRNNLRKIVRIFLNPFVRYLSKK